MDNRNSGTSNRFQVTQVTSYHPGDEFFLVENTLLNQGATPLTVDVFAAGDIYLADDDFGFGYFDANSRAVGAIDSNRVNVLFVQAKPGTPLPTFYQVGDYTNIWRTIGLNADFNNSAVTSQYLDIGAGLEWANVTIAPGGTTNIAYRWSFGAPAGVQRDQGQSAPIGGSGTRLDPRKKRNR
jgi:hypothetical protein